MVIMLFGVSNVGKTATGQKLAQRIKYSFIDLDDEIKKKFQMTLEEFMKNYPFTYERSKIKGKLLCDLVYENKENDIVIAVSPIWYARTFNKLFDLEYVTAIELQDSEENIFERLVFSGGNDNVYKDNEYKNKNRDHYIKDIHEDIVYLKRTFKKIKNKCFINNRSIDEVVEELITIIK